MTATQTIKATSNQSERYIRRRQVSKGGRFGKSIEDVLASIYGGMARNNATIEDISIRQNQVVVKYLTPDSSKTDLNETTLDGGTVEIGNVDVYGLEDGKLFERFKPVYQIKRMASSRK